MTIKAVISDLYGVHLHRDEQEMLANFVRVSGLTPDVVAQAIEESGRAALKIGEIEACEYVSNLNARLQTNLTVKQVQEIWNKTLRLDRQMLTLLRWMQSQGIRIVLLSNLNVFDWAGASSFGLAQFDAVLSYQVGVKKPNPQIFDLALEQTGLAANQHIFIDDQMKNVDIAIAADMQATQFVGYSKLLVRLQEAGLITDQDLKSLQAFSDHVNA